MGNDDDEYVDTDWSGRPVPLRPWMDTQGNSKPGNLKLIDGHLYLRQKDGTWFPATGIVTEEINGRDYTRGDDGKWYPVDENRNVGKEPVDPYADEGS